LLAAILGGGLFALNIYISPYPVIEFFDAEPVVVNPGNSLQSELERGSTDKVEINPGIGDVMQKALTSIAFGDHYIHVDSH